MPVACHKSMTGAKIFFLPRVTRHDKFADMIKPLTKSEGVRLPVDTWPKLRELIQAKGRKWLVSVIERAHQRMSDNKGAKS